MVNFLSVEFRLLGDVEARIADRLVNIGHLRQRCVLAVLLVEAGQTVPIGHLLERVWGDHPPQRARGTLYSYLSRLRQALATATDVGIERQPGGYALSVDPMAVDLHRFHHLLAQARAAGDDDEAATVSFDRALRLWRGRAFAMLDTPWLNTVRAGLDRQRRAAELDRNDLALRRGRHGELLDELTALAAADPLDERLAGQLLLALYRCGRQADALNYYQQVRLRLVEELGADPSPPLRQLHHQVLTADPVLDAPTRVVTAPQVDSRRSPLPRQLPAAPVSFTGRVRELAELNMMLSRQPDRGATVVVSAIGGAGGIGKTWLALRWAHDNLQRFPDGQLYVNLRGFDHAAEPVSAPVALRAFLDALGVAPATLPVDADAQAGLYRSLVAGRRMLVILDNVRDSSQVIPLLPGSDTCTVLVTSRHQLAGLVAAHGARPLALDALTDVEARQLLARQLGADRMAGEPEPVAALLRHCAGLPLALGIISARAIIRPDRTLAALADELNDTSTRLDALDAGELTVNVRAVMSCSYQALAPEAAHMFGLLGLAPGPDISLAAAASLAALTPSRARLLLGQLATAHLVQEHAPGRYRMHDLVRLYAAEQAHTLDTEHEQRLAAHRVLDHYLHTAHAAARLLNPHRLPITIDPPQPGVTAENPTDDGAALAWFISEHTVLLAAVAHAAEAAFDTHTWQLVWTLANYLERRGHWHAFVAAQRSAVDAARRLADQAAQANAHRGLANAYALVGQHEDAHTHLQQALSLFGLLDDRPGQAHTHIGLGWLLARQGHVSQALSNAQQALDLFQTAGDRTGQANALNNIGWYHAQLGNYEQTLVFSQQALALFRELDRFGEATAWDSLGYAHHHLGHHDQSATCYQHALDLFHDLGVPYNEAEVLTHLGDTQHAAGDPDAARQAWRRALAILDQLGHGGADQLRTKLHDLDHATTAAPSLSLDAGVNPAN